VRDTLPACESRLRGRAIEARRSGLAKAPSFDEAAVETGLVFLARGARQRASAAGTRPSRWPNTPRGRSAPRKALDQEPTGPSSAGSKGNRGTSRARPKLGARRQARLYPRSCRSPVLRRWWAAMEATARGESRRWGDSGVMRFTGCSYRNVGCRSWVDASSLEGQSAPKGASSLHRVASRGGSSLTKGVDSRWVKGCGVSAGERIASACKPASAARPEVEPTEGVPAPASPRP
jgi:hypothetical protein